MPAGALITESDRLIVRRLEPTHVASLAQLWADPAVTHFMGGPRDIAKVTSSLREVLAAPSPAKFDLWPTFEKASGELVGQCGLLPKTVDGRNEVELVYVLRADAWGRGYATEVAKVIRDYAFDILGLKRLVALIDPEHTASARVATKAGMTFESKTLRPNGKTLHVYALGI